MINRKPFISSQSEVYISVDVETSGPIPGEFSLLTIGACVVYDDTQAFECRIKPTTDKAVPEALRVTGLSLDELRRNGSEPVEAMQIFQHWILSVSGEATPVFVGLNAGFDWSFINYYFHLYLNNNPFGFAPLDIKSLYMGTTRCAWDETRSSKMVERLHPERHGDHDALDDARAQAELFRLIMTLD